MRPKRARARRWHGRLGLVVALATAACTGDDDDSAPTTAPATSTTVVAGEADGRLVLGALLPRTGAGAKLGEPMIAAVQATVDEINAAGGVLGQDVRLEIVDENAGGGMAQLVELGVDAIVGPASSRVALAELDDAVQPGTGVVTCSPSATALSLDDYPDNRLFFRTVPSDSMQMAAIATRVADRGVNTVAVAFLDDLYGRGLNEAFMAEAAERAFEVDVSVPFAPDQQDMSSPADEILADDPPVVVVLGGPDDTTRLLAALDVASSGDPPEVIVNDAVRDGRQAIAALSDRFRDNVIGVAPLAKPVIGDAAGFFTLNAIDCVNLIALAAVEAESDSPARIQTTMAAVSREGKRCSTFVDCVQAIGDGLQIDYNGQSGGSVDLSTTTGDLTSGWFEVFGFDATGADTEAEGPFQVG
jgi:branched-chain amino acid transport system substrate-binding protein